MPGVVAVITAADIKGTNRIRFLVPDQPVLCEDRVRYMGDPIAGGGRRDPGAGGSGSGRRQGGI